MHVLILNQTFYPDTAATGQLMWDLARRLDARGHRVTAVTSRHFYGTDKAHESARETIGRIQIHRLGGTAFGKRTLAARLSDFASFYVAAARHLQRHPLPDVILALTSPPMISALGMWQKQFRRKPDGGRVALAYYVMDLYPDAAVASEIMRSGNLIERVMRRMTSRTLALSDAVIVLGHDMRDRILARHGPGIRPERVHVVQPWADGQALFPLSSSGNSTAGTTRTTGAFDIVYSGNLGEAHDLETMLAAMRIMCDDPATRWIFIGGGKRFDELRDHVAREGWRHVQLRPFQQRSELNASLNAADVHLVSQLPEFTGVVVPSKMFGILAVGKPAVMIGPPDAECARVLTEAGAGFVVPNGDADALVARLRQLRDDPQLRKQFGRAARVAFEKNYDEPVACGRIIDVLESLVPTKTGGASEDSLQSTQGGTGVSPVQVAWIF